MTRDEFFTRWTSLRDNFQRFSAKVDGQCLVDELLADLSAVFGTEENAPLSLSEAARESGYSADHLSRLVRQGVIPNAGRPRSPRISRKDLPKKATSLLHSRPRPQLLGATPEDIARSVVNSNHGATR